MAIPRHTPDAREMALAWLWSRPQAPDTDASIDLETLDRWRQGRLNAARAAQVKRQLANDPRLMRMLEELVAADELLGDWTAPDAPKGSPSVWTQMRQVSGKALSRLLEPLWVGGLIAVAASVLLAVILLPATKGPDFNGTLDELYAALELPPDAEVLPWGPRIALRGSVEAPTTAESATPEVLAKQAFQAGVSEGIEQLGARYPELEVRAAEQLARDLPDCVAGDSLCRRQLELARVTGRWALAAHLQCRATDSAASPDAFATLDPLQTAWLELSPDHPLGSAVQAVSTAPDTCMAIRQLLRTWGR